MVALCQNVPISNRIGWLLGLLLLLVTLHIDLSILLHFLSHLRQTVIPCLRFGRKHSRRCSRRCSRRHRSPKRRPSRRRPLGESIHNCSITRSSTIKRRCLERLTSTVSTHIIVITCFGRLWQVIISDCGQQHWWVL
jgi:hypothetical protein